MRKTLLAVSIACFLGVSFPALPDTARTVPPLALAKSYKPNIDVTAYWVSEKMDGARAFWNGRQLVSRSGLVFHAPEWFLAGFPDTALDGELWMGRGRFEELMHTIRDQQPDEEAWRSVGFWVFDMPQATGNFASRQNRLRSEIERRNLAYLHVVEQWRVQSHEELNRQLKQLVEQGAEGLMLQQADENYSAGRHRGLLKLPAIGTQVSYRYQGRTGKGLPRFARFLRVRPME